MQNGVSFSRLRAEFTRQNGQLTIRDGVVKGPMIGGTIEGSIDYPGNQVRMSGTFVPMYGLNNMFGQIPIVGLILGGGSNEGLIGVTYEMVGTPGQPVLRVNPISAMAPGRAPEDLRVQHRQAEQPDRISAQQLIRTASDRRNRFGIFASAAGRILLLRSNFADPQNTTCTAGLLRSRDESFATSGNALEEYSACDIG